MQGMWPVYRVLPQEGIEADFEGKPVIKVPEACIGCMACDYRCPDFAMTLVVDEGE